MRSAPILILLALVIAPAASLATDEVPMPVVVRGPYLQMATPTSVVVRWRTNVATTSRVRLMWTGGDLGRSEEQSFVGPAKTKEHEVTVTGLVPERRYQYSVGSATRVFAAEPDMVFEAMPRAGKSRPVRMWVLGDSGRADSNARAVRDGFYGWPGSEDTDFWLMLGDNAYSHGTDSQYQAAVFDMYPKFLRSRVLWPTRGNHDDVRSGENNDYYELFTLPSGGESGGVPSGTEAYYSVDWANVHLICLDSMGSDRRVGGAMHTWLQQDLAATDADWIIAFWHHPPYSKGSHDSDNVTDSGGRLVDMRRNFVPTLEAGGVDLVLSGHSHTYERSYLIDGHYGYSSSFSSANLIDGGDGNPQGDGAYEKETPGKAAHEGTVYVVAGNSGKVSHGTLNHAAMFRSISSLGSMVIDVNGKRLDALELDEDGDVRDRFRIVKGTGAVDVPLGSTGPGGGPLNAGDVASREAIRLDVAGNPFRESVRIEYGLPYRGVAQLTVYDLQGRRIARLFESESAPGHRVVVWNGRDDAGRDVASGVYFAVLTFDGTQRARRLVKAR